MIYKQNQKLSTGTYFTIRISKDSKIYDKYYNKYLKTGDLITSFQVSPSTSGVCLVDRSYLESEQMSCYYEEDNLNDIEFYMAVYTKEKYKEKDIELYRDIVYNDLIIEEFFYEQEQKKESNNQTRKIVHKRSV